MHLKFRNVNDAFYKLVAGIHNGSGMGGVVPIKSQYVETIFTTKKESRNGPVLMIEEPVIITYEKPTERVLFDANRDCNPFFHLFEALWMLAGSNELAPVQYYADNVKNYSDDGKTMNGAYGYRWRRAQGEQQGYDEEWQHKEVDQLNLLVEHLRSQPESRRAVLQMWNVEDDLLKIGGLKSDHPDAGQTHAIWLPSSKDVCCNISVMFSIRETYYIEEPNNTTQDTGVRTKYLDMTVTNRSNDMIWGMLGANYVHFSFLQQYMADRLGVRVGVYNQISNNLHVYLNNWKPEKWLENFDHADCYPELPRIPLVVDEKKFDAEVKEFVEDHYGPLTVNCWTLEWDEPFLQHVAKPMCLAFAHHKERRYEEAFTWINLVKLPDWRAAGTEWLQRRQVGWAKKQV